jgi:hypothetical protein
VFANACNQEGALDRLFLLRQVGKMKKVHDVPKYNHAKRYLFSKQQYWHHNKNQNIKARGNDIPVLPSKLVTEIGG